MVKFTDWLSDEPFELIEEEAKKARRRFLAVYRGEGARTVRRANGYMGKPIDGLAGDDFSMGGRRYGLTETSHPQVLHSMWEGHAGR